MRLETLDLDISSIIDTTINYVKWDIRTIQCSISIEKTAIQLNLELEVGGWVAPFDLIVFGFGLLAWQKFLKQGCYIRRHRVKSLTSVWPLIGVKPLTMICCRRSVMYLSQWCTTVEIETICRSILPTIVHQPYNCTEVN